MQAKLNDLPVTLDIPDLTIREAEWGDLHVGYETYHRDFDTSPFLDGLPDSRCQCPHWGVVLKGSMSVNYDDRDDHVGAGETYYLAPGHRVSVSAGTELLEYSPKEPYAQTMDVIGRNVIRLLPELGG